LAPHFFHFKFAVATIMPPFLPRAPDPMVLMMGLIFLVAFVATVAT